MLKRNLTFVWKTHREIFGLPKHKPTINCCIDVMAWESMATKLNSVFTQKN